MKLDSKFVLLILLLTARVSTQAAVDFYSPNPDHLWNRLYSGLFVRTGGGAVFDDLMDPMFVQDAKDFRTGESNAAATALLREFADSREALGQMTPLQRAVMQRDLLAMFHLVPRAVDGQREMTAEERNLCAGLVRAIRHVALTADEIRKLPDNYAVAAGLPGAFTSFDDANPGRAFLPKDLLADDGAWLALEPRRDRPLAAPVHFQIFGNLSSFDLHFRHPGGREAGKKYLDELAAFPDPFVTEKPKEPIQQLFGTNAKDGVWVNPQTPQFPTGAMWALVRRAILVDTQGDLVVSPLVESVEVRVYRALAEFDANQAETDKQFESPQTFFEWELSRRLLFSKGGFHLMDGRDLLFSPFFHERDKLEGFTKRKPDEPLVCFACHSAPGIHSVNSRTLLFGGADLDFESKPQPERPGEFRAVTRKRLAEVAVEVASKRPGWQQLRRMWDEK